MELYHFSSESNIDLFKPRVKHNRKYMPPVVWAIDKEHEFTFFFPRDCPRIVYTRSQGMNEADESRFFGVSDSNIIITVESHWFKAIKEATIYRYTLPVKGFELFDKTAGYYISEQAVEPMEMQPIQNLLERILDLNIELRFTPNLYPLRKAILNSSMTDFGIHRFENAKNI